MKQNKLVFIFLIKFFVVYFSLTSLYSLYLKNTQQSDEVFKCSPITNTVAEHSKLLIENFGYDLEMFQSNSDLSILCYLEKIPVAMIVEGCTAISIMILFLSFIVAFSGKVKHTIIFGLIGLFIIYIANILRITVFLIALYHFPEYQEILHDLVFPGIIYGMVFILWVIWVRNFATLNKTKHE